MQHILNAQSNILTLALSMSMISLTKIPVVMKDDKTIVLINQQVHLQILIDNVALATSNIILSIF